MCALDNLEFYLRWIRISIVQKDFDQLEPKPKNDRAGNIYAEVACRYKDFSSCHDIFQQRKVFHLQGQ